MPIVDGLTSAKMIRAFETTHPSLPSSPSPSPTPTLSPRAQLNSRVPIFAVSASLVEGKRQTYISAGFDGWILKPIDFKRLNIILNGIVDEGVRESCLYRPGEWECGGWFKARGEGRRSSGERSLGVSTSGSRSESATASTTGSAKGLDGSGSLQSSDSGSMTPVGDGSAKNAFFYDERLGPVKEERAGRIRTSADAIADRKEDVGGM
jgi:CheY-like chemotaxis protein